MNVSSAILPTDRTFRKPLENIILNPHTSIEYQAIAKDPQE